MKRRALTYCLGVALIFFQSAAFPGRDQPSVCLGALKATKRGTQRDAGVRTRVLMEDTGDSIPQVKLQGHFGCPGNLLSVLVAWQRSFFVPNELI